MGVDELNKIENPDLTENVTLEEQKVDAKIEEQVQETKSVKKGAFDKLEQTLTEEDLKNPAIARMLINSIDTLTTEKLELENSRDKFYDADKKCAVLEEDSKGETRFQVMYGASFAIGGIVFGTSFATQGATSVVLITCGAILLIQGAILNFFILKK